MLEYHHVINYIHSFNSYNACQNYIKYSLKISLPSSNVLICMAYPQGVYVPEYFKFINIEINFLSKSYRKKVEILILV